MSALHLKAKVLQRHLRVTCECTSPTLTEVGEVMWARLAALLLSDLISTRADGSWLAIITDGMLLLHSPSARR